MNQKDSEFLYELAPKLLDGSYKKNELKRFIHLVDEGSDQAEKLRREIFDQYDIDEKDYLEIISDYIVSPVDLLNHSLRMKRPEAFQKFIARDVCCIFFHLISAYFQKYSLADLFTFAVCIGTKYFCETDNFDLILNRVDCFFKTGKLAINNYKYEFITNFVIRNLSFETLVFSLCILTMVSVLEYEFPEMESGEIIDFISTDIEDLKLYFNLLLARKQAFKLLEEVRIFSEKEMHNENMISFILSKNFEQIFPDTRITDLNEHSFINYSENIMGDGFTIKKAYRFIKDFDTLFGQKQEHDDFLSALSKMKPEIVEFLKSEIPELSSSYIKNNEFSYDPAIIFIIGLCYLFGIFVKKDFKKAYKLFYKSSKRYVGGAAYWLSVMYLKSLHVSFKANKWLYYLSLSCKLGNENAIREWKSLEEAYIRLVGPFSESCELNSIQDISMRTLSRIRLRFLDKTDLIIESFTSCDPHYLENINTIFSIENNIEYAKSLDKLILYLDWEDFEDEEKAKKIGDVLFKMAKAKMGDKIKNYSQHSLEELIGPACCWYFLAYSLGSEESLILAAKPYGLNHLQKTRCSNKIIKDALLQNHSASLLFAYGPLDEVMLEELVNNGMEVAAGFLIKPYFKRENINGCKEAFRLFMNSSALHERILIAEYINKDPDQDLAEHSNICDCLIGRSSRLKITKHSNYKKDFQFSKGDKVLFFFSFFFFIFGIALAISFRNLSCLGPFLISAFFLIFGTIKTIRHNR